MATASPSGAQVVFDGENPRTFTGVATGSILAGMLVVSNPAKTAQAVGSTVSTFLPTDIEILPIADGNRCNGLALNTISSGTNNLVTVATRGTYILRAGGAISGGQGIVPGSEVIQYVNGEAPSISWSGTTIGRALTNSASGTNLYLLATLNV